MYTVKRNCPICGTTWKYEKPGEDKPCPSCSPNSRFVQDARQMRVVKGANSSST